MADICGIHIGGETLSLLALKPAKRGGWSVRAGAIERHAAGETDDLTPAIKSLAKAAKSARGKTTIILPKQQAILRNVLLPSVDRDELIQMARFEAERHIPFHAERHSTGYHVMRSMGVEGSEVVLGAVDGPIVHRALAGVTAAGFPAGGVTLSSVALVNSLLFSKQDWVKGKTIGLLAVGLDTLDLVFLHDGRLIFARSVSLDLRGVLAGWRAAADGDADNTRLDAARLATAARMIDCNNLEGHYSPAGTSLAAGAAPSAEAAERVRGWIERLIQELRRTYDFARREMKCPPIDAVVLTGEGALLRNLTQYLYVNLNVEVQTINPVGALAGGQKFPFEGLEYVIPFGGMIASGSAGVPLPGAFRLDLTPGDYHRQISRKRMMRQLITTGVLSFFAIILCVVTLLRYQGIRARQFADYAEANDKMKVRVAELEEMKTKLHIIRGFMDDPNSALVVLSSIAASQTIPKRVGLTKVDYTKGKDAKIEGEAIALPDINTFIQDLRATGHFEKITRPRDPTPMPRFGQNVYDFNLQLDFKANDEKGASPAGAAAASTEANTNE